MTVHRHEVGDCHLLSALPRSLGDVSRDIAAGPNRHYVRTHSKGKTPEQAWRKPFSNIARNVAEVFNAARLMGAGTEECASIEHLQTAAENSQVIILFAHWKGHAIEYQDFLVDPARIAQDILGSTLPVAQSLKSKIGERKLIEFAENSDEVDQASLERSSYRLARVLTAAIEDRSLFGELEFDAHDSLIAAFNRESFDSEFNQLIAPGNRLELTDKLHSIEAIIEAFPTEWGGTLDLAICTSTVISDLLKEPNPSRLIIQNTDLVQPVSRLRLVNLILERLREVPMTYIDAYVSVMREIRRAT